MSVTELLHQFKTYRHGSGTKMTARTRGWFRVL
jgi:hypothetical protein